MTEKEQPTNYGTLYRTYKDKHEDFINLNHKSKVAEKILNDLSRIDKGEISFESEEKKQEIVNGYMAAYEATKLSTEETLRYLDYRVQNNHGVTEHIYNKSMMEKCLYLMFKSEILDKKNENVIYRETDVDFLEIKEIVVENTNRTTLNSYLEFYKNLYSFYMVNGTPHKGVSDAKFEQTIQEIKKIIEHVEKIRNSYNEQREDNPLSEKYKNNVQTESPKEENNPLSEHAPIAWANIAKCYHTKHRYKKKLKNGTEFCKILYEKLKITSIPFDTFHTYFRKCKYHYDYDKPLYFKQLEEIINAK